MTDWGTRYGGGSSGGSGGWGARYGGGGGGSSSPSGGGGLFDWIGHEVQSHVPFEHQIGGALSGAGYVARNLNRDVAQTINALPNFIPQLAHQAAFTFGPQGVSQSLGQAWSDPRGLIGGTLHPAVSSTLQDVHNVRTGNWHALAQHPLSPILDVASLASFGGGAALRGAEAARAAGVVSDTSRVGRLASDSGRVIKDAGLSEQLPRAKTVQGRVGQNLFDQFSMAHPDAPLVGSQARLTRIAGRRAYYRTQSELAVGRDMIRKGEKPLKPDEQFAVHIAAEGVPLHERIQLFQQLDAENPSHALKQYIHAMQRPGVAAALKNPSDALVNFTNTVKGTEAKSGEALMTAGKLTPEARAERALAPQLQTAEHGIQIGANDISSKLPQGFRFPHVGTEGKPSAFSTPLGSLIGPKAPGFLRKSRMIRWAKAQIITNPAAVYSHDFMSTARYLHQLDLQDEVMTPASRELNVARVSGYGKPHDGYFYWPAKAQEAARAKGLTNRSIPRVAREAQGREQDLAMLSSNVREAGAESAVKASISEHLSDLGLEGSTIEHLKELGVRWVPARYAQSYAREFQRTNAMVRLFVQRPTDFWRSLTLKYRPAWAVNNLLGQHLLYAMENPTVGGAVAYASAAAGHRKNADLFQSIPGMRQGFAHTQSRVTRAGTFQPLLDRSSVARTAKLIATSPKFIVRGVQGVGNVIQRFNELGENIPREAQFIRLAMDRLDGANKTLAEAVRTADPKVVERLVDEINKLQGDFGRMSRLERSTIRTIVPFYAWFKVITKLTVRYAARYPARTKMLQANAAFLNEQNTQLPSYLQGFVKLMDKGGVLTGLSTTGANPFETVDQLLSAGGSVLHGKPAFSTSNPGGLLNPFAQSGITALTGKDLFTGGDYYGPGANQGILGRAAGDFISGLPEYRLAEQAAGMGPKSSLYSQERFAGLPPYLWNYLGLPIRRVKKNEAATRTKAGQ